MAIASIEEELKESWRTEAPGQDPEATGLATRFDLEMLQEVALPVLRTIHGT